MGKILNAEEGKHVVDNYFFKSFEFDDNSDSKQNPQQEKPQQNTQSQPQPQQQPQSNGVKFDKAHIEMIEQLLKKSDDLSSAVIRLEQKLETQAKECENRIAQTQENAYKTGYNEGYNKAKAELENKINEHLSKLIESIHKVEEVYKEYQTKAEGIEKELVSVAVDIAQEVIAKELSAHSKEIALSLTKELINDIKEATQIEVKLNPIDYDYVKENINLEKITIKPDNAITPGGVVIISDAGNIEAEVHERFNAIKSHILDKG